MMKRPRLECPYCKEILSYSSYRRHIETKLCLKPDQSIFTQAEHEQGKARDEATESTQESLEFLDVDHHDHSSDFSSHEVAGISAEKEMLATDIHDTDSSSDSENSGPEIWDVEVDVECEPSNVEKEHAHKLLYSISYFLLFFQLCYKVSDSAIKHILNLMTSLLYWVPFFLDSKNSSDNTSTSDNTNLTELATNFPKTLYTLKKTLGVESDLMQYCVCPTCHTLYKEKDCLQKCEHIEFPNHPYALYRQRCGTELMKSIKVERSYKLVPRKIYVYNSIMGTLQKLILRPGFIESCEKWRKANSSDGFMTDVYDGKLWKEEWKEYLKVPGNLLLMLNVDWFRVFKHSSYSIGMIYLVIQNLPRELRFKPENILIVSSIPGPHEPKLTINSYLKPMVDELLNLWKGVQLKYNSSILGYRTIRVEAFETKGIYQTFLPIRPVSIMLQNFPIMLFSISQIFAYYTHFYAS